MSRGGLLGATESSELPAALLRVRDERWSREHRVSPHAAATDLKLWLAFIGCDGWLTAGEIDEGWKCRRRDLKLAPIPQALIRETLRGLPGVRYMPRARVKQEPEFADVRKRITADARVALYFIPQLPEGMSIPGLVPDQSLPAPAPPGHCPGSARTTGGHWVGIGKIFGKRAA